MTDADGTNSGTSVSFDGTADKTLKLPSTIKASLTGNASSANEFHANQSIALTGDATGTASSKAGWSIPVTLTNTGVSAGRYNSVQVDSKGRVVNGNVRHSYTTPVNSAKNWFRIANAVTNQTDLDHPLHVQFFLTAYNTAENTDYYQRWFVDAEIFGRNSGIRIFGNGEIPFNQARVSYESTDADIDSSDRPYIDIYLNAELSNETACHVEIEEVYNSGFEFVSNGELSASTVTNGFESRAVGTYSSGVKYSMQSDYALRTTLQRTDLSADATLSNSDAYRMKVLNCTGTITLTLPSLNSEYAWFLIKNFNAASGTVTIHPSTTSVLIDGSNSDIVLQPKEWILISSKATDNYSIIGDGRWLHQVQHLNGLKLAEIPLGTLLGEVVVSNS